MLKPELIGESFIRISEEYQLHLILEVFKLKKLSVLEKTESARNEIIELASELVKISTPNPPGSTSECVRFIRSYFDQHGVPTKIFERTKGKTNIVAHIKGADDHTVLWLGHLDVVPEGDTASWKHEPYGGKVVGDFIYGRGTSDMKGSCAAAMVATRILGEAGKLPFNTDFWFTCDEEVGGGDGAEWLSKENMIRGDCCIIGDSSGSTRSKPFIDAGCKGMLWTKIKATGRTAHGSTPHLGDNALDKIMAITPHIEKMRNYRLNVAKDLRPALKTSVDYLLSNRELSEEQRRTTKRLYNYPTVALNMLNGGVKINVVPDHAEAFYDIRLTPGIDFAATKKQLLKLIESPRIEGITHEFIQEQTGYFESPKSKFAKQLSKAVRTVTENEPKFKILTGGTDAASLTKIGIPCLGYGAGLEGQAHAPDEHVPIDDLVMAAKVYALFPLIYRA